MALEISIKKKNDDVAVTPMCCNINLNDILNLENLVEAVKRIVKFAKEFLDLIDAADATSQADIAREALKKLAS